MILLIVVDAVVVVAGLLVLALLGWRLWGQVRALGHEVAVAGDRLAAVSAELESLHLQA